MAKERRTDITGEQRPTTRRAAVVGSGTDKNPPVGAVGRKTTIRPGTGRTAAIGSGTGKAGSVKSGTGYVRRKKFPFDKLILGIVLAVAGYYGWGYYQKEMARKAAKELALQQEEANRIAQEKAAEQAAAEARRKKAEEEENKRLAEERQREEEAEAKVRAAAEAEAEQKRAEAEKERIRLAGETEKREAVVRAKTALEKLKSVAAEAKKLNQEGKFAEAAKLLDAELAESGKLLSQGEDVPYRQMLKNATAFADALEQIKPAPESSAENMFWFTLRGGGKIRGKVASDLGSEIVLVGNGGVRSRLPSDSVASRVEVEQKDLDEELKKRIESLAKAAKSGVDWFMLGREALLGNQPTYAVRAFNKAEEVDPAVGQNVRENKARFLLASGIFNRAIDNQRVSKERLDMLVKEYGDTRAAKIYQNAGEEEKTLTAQVAVSASGSYASDGSEDGAAEVEVTAAAKAINDELDQALESVNGKASIMKADVLVSQARTLEEKAQASDDSAKANALYKEAADKLLQALAMYRESKGDKKVNQDKLGTKMTEATSRLYWCRKLQTL